MGDLLALGGRDIEPSTGAHWWRDWGDLIRAIYASDLPYLGQAPRSGIDPSTPILDATFGRGVFWSRFARHPSGLVTNDIDMDRDAEHRWNWLTEDPPEDWLAHFWAVVFDPPFKLSGTNRIMLDRYGLDDDADNQTRLSGLEAGTLSVARCVAPGGYLLVKCQPQVAGGKVRWQPRTVANLLEAQGWLIEDEFVFQYRPVPQPGNRQQRHARRNYSVLIVAQAPKEISNGR